LFNNDDPNDSLTSEEDTVSTNVRTLADLVSDMDRALRRAPGPDLLVNDRPLKDIVSHLLGWNLLTIASINQALTGISPLLVSDIDRFNQSAALLLGDYPWDLLLEINLRVASLLCHSYRQAFSLSGLSSVGVVEWLEIDIAHYKEHLVELS